jgi:outer membrane receptor protein involved in Fe transport
MTDLPHVIYRLPHDNAFPGRRNVGWLVNGLLQDYKYTDLQISDFIAATISQLTLNAGSSKTEGFEVEVQWRVNHELTVNGGFGYSRARYIQFDNIACYGGQLASTGCNETTALQLSSRF